MVPEPGEYVGPYEILGQLGAGGMGVVYRAWDERLHREVALKLLQTQYDTPNLRERFLIEARAASALNHPNICTIFDLGEQEGEPFLVMELLSGETLKEKTARGALPTEEIVRISIEISDALAWAHSKGVIHRDIKPANVFLVNRPGGQMQAKVLDFGLAKITASSRSGRASRALELTSAGSTVGTLAYMSPEQARGEALDARSDLFSLGVLMYEMCTRRVPFRGATSAMVFAALLSQDPESIRNWNDAIPRDLERLVYRLLAKNRNERFQTAHEFHEALRRLTLKGEGDWLRKLPRPAVPLVPSLDPVARAPRGRLGGGEDTSSAEEIAAPLVPFEEDASSGEHLLRPRRLPRRESGPRESAFGALTERRPEQKDPSQFAEIAARIRAVQESSGAIPTARSEVQPVREGGRPSSGRVRSSSRTVPEGAYPEQPVSRAGEPERPERSVPAREIASLALVPTSTVALAAVAADPATPAPLVSAAGSDSPRARAGGRRRWALLGITVLGLLVAFVVYKLLRGGLAQVVLRPGDAVLLAPIQNKTGEPDLDRAIAQGLEIELAEHSPLHFDGLAAYRAGVRQIVAETHASERGVTTQGIAERIGARAYLYGELMRSGSGYSLALTVVDAASNDRMASLSAEAANREGLAAAITEISVALRRRLGEVVDARQPTPLAQQGSGNMAALQSYADAGIAVEDGQTLQAIAHYQQAVADAPGFALADVRLAWLLESQGAEVEAAEAAQAAQAASRRAGDRVAAMALYTRQALSDRDLSAAALSARAMTVARPQDVESLIAITRVMRLGGHMTEALLSSEQAVRRGPFHLTAYNERAHALVALGRYGDALRVRFEAAKAGLGCDCASIAAAYLGGGAAGGDQADTPGDIATGTDRALVLDNAGRLAEGLRSWEAAAAQAQREQGMGSAAAGALSQAALDRALLGRCAEVRTLVGESANLLHGPLAKLRTGVASALCGFGPESRSEGRAEVGGLHSQISELYLPMLRAAEALRGREPMRAVGELSSVKEQRDASPLLLYLRGTAHLAQQQSELAAEDFGVVTAHRGRAFLSGSAVYGPALASLTRARLERGDTVGGARARAELLQVYSQADPGLMRADRGSKARGTHR